MHWFFLSGFTLENKVDNKEYIPVRRNLFQVRRTQGDL